MWSTRVRSFLVVVILLAIQARLCLSATSDAPTVPATVFAREGASTELPCLGSRGDKLMWEVPHETASLRNRMSSAWSGTESVLSALIIKEVEPSDAGVFECSNGRKSSPAQLVVLSLSRPYDLEAKVTAADEVKLFWQAPRNDRQHVMDYVVYVTEVTSSTQTVKFSVGAVSSRGREEFLLEDMAPGATYEMQVAAVYPMGVAGGGDVVESKKSPKIRISTPTFDAPPSRVSARPGPDSAILVTWDPPRNVDSRSIDGYKVFFKTLSRKANAPSGEVVVTSPGPGNRWQALLKGLKIRQRYVIEVVALTGGSRQAEGRRSPAVTFRHDGFASELSVRAIPLGPETAMVTVSTIGPGQLSKLRLLYSDDTAVQWKRVKGYKAKDKFAVVTNLQPRSLYYFTAKARMGRKARSATTHITTPPSGLSTARNVSVTAKTDHSVLVTWSYTGQMTPAGFIAIVDSVNDKGETRPHSQQPVFKVNEALIDNLDDSQEYKVKVVPFDLHGVSTGCESVNFRLAATDLKTTTTAPEMKRPHFVNTGPPNMEINAGDDVKLSCTALGHPHPQVTWFMDGAQIGAAADRSNELFLKDLQKSTVLTCRASNLVGTLEADTNVRVTHGIEQDDVPQLTGANVTVKEGDTAVLSCKAKNLGVRKVVWMDDTNKPLTIGNYTFTGDSRFNIRRPGPDDWNLHIRSVRPSDARLYTCKVSSPTHNGINIYLTVLPQDKEPQLTGTNVTVKEGDTAILPCKAKNLAAKTVVVWTNDENTLLTMGSRRLINDFRVSLERPFIEDWNLHIRSARPTDSGPYTCKISSGPSVEVYLTVLPQVIPPEPKVVNVTVMEGTSVLLPCQVENLGNKQVSWAKQGRDALTFGLLRVSRDPRFERFSIEQADAKDWNLQIEAARDSDQGEYVCSVDKQPVARVFLSVLQKRSLPRLVGDTPSRIVKRRGERVDIVCRFDGVPTPNVTWFHDSKPIGAPSKGSNILVLPAVDESTTLTCRGENAFGFAEKKVELVLEEPATPPPGENDYVVTSRTGSKSDSMEQVDWDVYRGDIDRIKEFRLVLRSESGRALMQQMLGPDIRSVTLTDLTPGSKYTLELSVRTAQGLGSQQLIPITAGARLPTTGPGQPDVAVDVVEVRDDSARVRISSLGLDPVMLQRYRLRVWDLDVRSGGGTIFDTMLSKDTPSIRLNRLKPSRRYKVKVDAMGRGVLASAGVNFRTAARGSYGEPVTSRLRQPPPGRNSTQAQRSTTTLTTTATTTATTTMTTTVHTTTYVPATTMDNNAYAMTLKTTNKTPYSVGIRWTVDRGDLQAIRGFVVIITGDRGQVLLRQDLKGNQRSITIQSLSPDSRYFFNLVARGRRGKLAENDLTVHTPSADATPDTSSPVLDLEASEVRATSARLDWTVVNGDTDAVKSYRLLVQDGGPSGFNLLTQDLPASSQSLNLQKLPSKKQYYVTVDAFGPGRQKLMTTSLTFVTPSPGQYGLPVRASSSDKKLSSPTSMETSPKEIHEPLLDLTVQKTGQSRARLTWSLVTGAPWKINEYKLTVKAKDKRGRTLLSDVLDLNTHYFTVSGLTPGQDYFMELRAMDSNGNTLLRAATPYTFPVDWNSPPVQVSSATTEDEAPLPPEVPTPPIPPTPELTLQINPSGASNARLNWTLTPSTSDLQRYRVVVRDSGPTGQRLMQKDMTATTAYFDVLGLLPSRLYYIQLSAIDSRGAELATASSGYRVPPPGYPVQPIVVSSQPAQTTSSSHGIVNQANQNEHANTSKQLVITKVQPNGPNTLYVEWFDITSPGGLPKVPTMVRYAKMTGTQRHRYNIKYVTIGKRHDVLTGLEADSRYIVQVATPRSGRHYIRWSEAVTGTTSSQ